MYFIAVAVDYDGTVALDGRMDEPTADAIRRLKAAGRHALLVTGRELDELKQVCPQLPLFDRVVAENGGLIYRPATDEIRALCEPPAPRLVEQLRGRGVGPVAVGRSILATWEPHQHVVLECIRGLGLELEIIFNKGAVMVLPSGINKASGLLAALGELGLSPLNVVGMGDAENDHAFLKICGCSAAMANAIPSLKEAADIVTSGDHGAGVAEVITQMIDRDLRDVPTRRHCVSLCAESEGSSIFADPRGVVLLSGTSGSGKSTMVNGFIERLGKAGYQYCVIDPEGDYEHVEGAITIGEPQAPPSPARVLEALSRSDQSVVVNMLGIPHADRPGCFAQMLPELLKLRASRARPHWLVIDEAHHLLPRSRGPESVALTPGFGGLLLVTVHPDEVSRPVLASVDTLLVTGTEPGKTIAAFAAAVGATAPRVDRPALESGELLLWRPGMSAPKQVQVIPAKVEHRRHQRKYADGALTADESFYFRGPEGKLQLKAQNLTIFLQMAEGVDDATWLHHLKAGDYSRWFRDAIKDKGLAAEVAAIEEQARPDPLETRRLVAQSVLKRYTAPAEVAPAQG
jgi:hydroxymethylpyrimidine pyrophosphatase-like HAD family hydrolase